MAEECPACPHVMSTCIFWWLGASGTQSSCDHLPESPHAHHITLHHGHNISRYFFLSRHIASHHMVSSRIISDHMVSKQKILFKCLKCELLINLIDGTYYYKWLTRNEMPMHTSLSAFEITDLQQQQKPLTHLRRAPDNLHPQRPETPHAASVT